MVSRQKKRAKGKPRMQTKSIRSDNTHQLPPTAERLGASQKLPGVHAVGADMAVAGQNAPVVHGSAAELPSGQYVVAAHVSCVASDALPVQKYPGEHGPVTSERPVEEQ